MVYPTSLVASPDGSELLIHASASTFLHGDKRAYASGNESSLLTFSLRKDGFVFLTPSGASGVLLTQPLSWSGGELSLNANCTGTASSLRVELREADDSQALAGYRFADSATFASDGLGWQPRWGTKSMDALSGKTLRVAVHLQGGARLYALRGSWNRSAAPLKTEDSATRLSDSPYQLNPVDASADWSFLGGNWAEPRHYPGAFAAPDQDAPHRFALYTSQCFHEFDAVF